MSGKRNAGSGKTKRSRKRGEKDIGLAESVDDYIFLDTYTGMRKMDEKDSTARQNLPVLGKPCRYANDILFYLSLGESIGLSLIKNSFDKAEESIEKLKRKLSSTFSLQG